MTQLEQLLAAFERRGGCLTTWEISGMVPRILQYNRAIKNLREAGFNITCEKIKGQKGNHLFTLHGKSETWGGGGVQRPLFSNDNHSTAA
jgi:hypothetical protein